MGEIGIDLRSAYNKTTAEAKQLLGGRVDLSVTMCAEGSQDCPYLPGARAHLHHAFDDPPHLAEAAGSADPLPFYRTVRGQIGQFIRTELPDHVPGFTRSVPLDDEDEEDATSGTAPLIGHDGAATAPGAKAKAKPGISFFEKYLTVWVALCMVFGALIGYYEPGIARGFAKAEFAHIVCLYVCMYVCMYACMYVCCDVAGRDVVSSSLLHRHLAVPNHLQSLPMAVLLWIMIFPMLLSIDFSSIKRVKNNPTALILTTMINYLVKPFTMYALAVLFFREVFRGVIDDGKLADEYIAGCVLLASAPCTAMVFVWSFLTEGDAAYTLMQVAVNDLV